MCQQYFFFALYTFKDTGIDLSLYFFGIRADRIAHFIMFLPYPFLAWHAIEGWFKKVFGRYDIAMLVLSGIMLALVAETLQNLNPNRDFDPDRHTGKHHRSSCRNNSASYI